jgi:hypothetical protein
MPKIIIKKKLVSRKRKIIQKRTKRGGGENNNIKVISETLISKDWIDGAKKQYENKYSISIRNSFTPKENVEYLNKFLIDKAFNEITESNPEINSDILKKTLEDIIKTFQKEIHDKKTLKLAKKNKSEITVYDENWAKETLKGFDNYIIKGKANRNPGESEEDYKIYLRRVAANLLKNKSGESKFVRAFYSPNSVFLQNWEPDDITKYYNHDEYLKSEEEAEIKKQAKIEAEKKRYAALSPEEKLHEEFIERDKREYEQYLVEHPNYIPGTQSLGTSGWY